LVEKRQLGREDRGTEEIVGREDSGTEETMVRRRSWDKEERETEKTVRHDTM
jgi:hypothetical protein